MKEEDGCRIESGMTYIPLRGGAPEAGGAADQLPEAGGERGSAADAGDPGVRGLGLGLEIERQLLRQPPAQHQLRPALQYVLRLGEGADQMLLAERLLEAADGK